MGGSACVRRRLGARRRFDDRPVHASVPVPDSPRARPAEVPCRRIRQRIVRSRRTGYDEDRLRHLRPEPGGGRRRHDRRRRHVRKRRRRCRRCSLPIRWITGPHVRARRDRNRRGRRRKRARTRRRRQRVPGIEPVSRSERRPARPQRHAGRGVRVERPGHYDRRRARSRPLPEGRRGRGGRRRPRQRRRARPLHVDRGGRQCIRRALDPRRSAAAGRCACRRNHRHGHRRRRRLCSGRRG